MAGALRAATVSALLAPHATRATPAESARFDRLSIDQGLSQSTVYCIAQDARGFLWFGTQDGLDQYDGQEFVSHRHEPSRPASIADNNVSSLLAEPDGTLWVGTDGGGLNAVETRSGDFVRYRHDPGDPASLSADWVTSIAPATDGGLWVGTLGGGLNKKSPGTGRFRRLGGDPSCGDRVVSLLQSRGGSLWVGTEASGLCVVEPGASGMRRAAQWLGAGLDARASIQALLEDREGTLWVGTQNGLASLDARGRVRRWVHDPRNPVSLSHDRVSALLEDGSGRLWVGTQAGLDRLARGTGEVVRHAAAAEEDGLGDAVLSLFEDRAGLLWVGTANSGVAKLNSRKSRFQNVSAGAGIRPSLSSPVVWGIKPARGGDVWVGTERGLNQWNPERGTIFQYLHDPSDAGSLGNDIVRALLMDREGTLWVGTDGGGLSRLRRPGGPFLHRRHSPRDPRSLCSDRILTLYEDRAGKVWVGTSGGGACHTRPDRDGFDTLRGETPGEERVYAIREDRQGVFWFGTLAGLISLDPRTGERRQFRHDPSDPSSLSNDGVGTVFEDRDGVLWAGTDRGLNRLDRASGRFVRYTVAEGLPNDFVHGILQDDDGYLWVSTNGGLSRLDPASGGILNLDVRDGLQSNEFNSGAYAVDADGRFYFGGMNGLSAFFPRAIEVNGHHPPVAITKLRVFDRPMPLPARGVVTLDHRQNTVSFDFAALDFSAPTKNRYAYRLDGVDRDWIPSLTRRSASYANLPGGRYTFRVKATNNDGVWSDADATLELRVQSPPWRRWWALGAYLVVLGAAAYAFEQYRARAQARNLTERIRGATTRLAHTLELDEVIAKLLEGLSALVRYEQATVFLAGPGGLKERLSRTGDGATHGDPADASLRGLASQVTAARQPVLLDSFRLSTEPRAAARRALGVPLEGHREPMLGAVVLVGPRGAALPQQDVNVAITIVGQASFAIENARLFDQIRHSATVDALTGVFNRRHFFESAERESKARLRHQRPLSVIMLDIDHFKRINDDYGHLVGDDVIRAVAGCCVECVRETDFVARYGGEEFVILLPETGQNAALVVAQRLCDAVAHVETAVPGRDPARVTASLGVATTREGETGPSSIVDRADAALYAAKRAGRNRVVSAEEGPLRP